MKNMSVPVVSSWHTTSPSKATSGLKLSASASVRPLGHAASSGTTSNSSRALYLKMSFRIDGVSSFKITSSSNSLPSANWSW